jgi:hypothetical protein
MNTERIQRKLNIVRLRIRSAICRLVVELEPAGSTESETLRKNYARAHGELQRALLKDRESDINRRSF